MKMLALIYFALCTQKSVESYLIGALDEGLISLKCSNNECTADNTSICVRSTTATKDDILEVFSCETKKFLLCSKDVTYIVLGKKCSDIRVNKPQKTKGTKSKTSAQHWATSSIRGLVGIPRGPLSYNRHQSRYDYTNHIEHLVTERKYVGLRLLDPLLRIKNRDSQFYNELKRKDETIFNKNVKRYQIQSTVPTVKKLVNKYRNIMNSHQNISSKTKVKSTVKTSKFKEKSTVKTTKFKVKLIVKPTKLKKRPTGDYILREPRITLLNSGDESKNIYKMNKSMARMNKWIPNETYARSDNNSIQYIVINACDNKNVVIYAGREGVSVQCDGNNKTDSTVTTYYQKDTTAVHDTTYYQKDTTAVHDTTYYQKDTTAVHEDTTYYQKDTTAVDEDTTYYQKDTTAVHEATHQSDTTYTKPYPEDMTAVHGASEEFDVTASKDYIQDIAKTIANPPVVQETETETVVTKTQAYPEDLTAAATDATNAYIHTTTRASDTTKTQPYPEDLTAVNDMQTTEYYAIADISDIEADDNQDVLPQTEPEVEYSITEPWASSVSPDNIRSFTKRKINENEIPTFKTNIYEYITESTVFRSQLNINALVGTGLNDPGYTVSHRNVNFRDVRCDDSPCTEKVSQPFCIEIKSSPTGFDKSHPYSLIDTCEMKRFIHCNKKVMFKIVPILQCSTRRSGISLNLKNVMPRKHKTGARLPR